jgi:hypothetical protein
MERQATMYTSIYVLNIHTMSGGCLAETGAMRPNSAYDTPQFVLRAQEAGFLRQSNRYDAPSARFRLERARNIDGEADTGPMSCMASRRNGS